MGCLGKFPSAWEKVLYRRFPQLVFTFVSPTFVSHESLGANSVGLEKGSVEGSPNYYVRLPTFVSHSSPNI